MNDSGESPEAIARQLKEMTPADVERVAKALLGMGGGTGVSFTSVNGDVVNSAIGTGATLSARDLLAMLGTEARAAREAEETRQALARLEGLLAARKFTDPSSADFGMSRYSKRMVLFDAMQRTVPIKPIGTFFALTPAPLVADGDRNKFFQWMDINQRCYAPLDRDRFLPGFMPVVVSKARVWHNGEMPRFAGAEQNYCTYFAAELDEGYLEYGFCAGSLLEPTGDVVYYAKVIGGFVAFLRFLRHFGDQFGVDPSAISIGLALRGTTRTRLRCITKQFMEHYLMTAHPDTDGFRWLREATRGEDWTVDGVARRAALALLDHWSYSGPAGAEEPEFTDGKYTGKYYLDSFRGQWC